MDYVDHSPPCGPKGLPYDVLLGLVYRSTTRSRVGSCVPSTVYYQTSDLLIVIHNILPSLRRRPTSYTRPVTSQIPSSTDEKKEEEE